MRLTSVTLSASVSALLLSGCSFFDGQSQQRHNPYAQQSGQYGQFLSGRKCQISSPRQAIPRGCRPEQVTIGVNPQAQAFGAPVYGSTSLGTNGFPQQPQFGQPVFASGSYGAAVGQTAAVEHKTLGPKKRKPKLRGALSFGVQESFSGDLLDFNSVVGQNLSGAFNPQDFNQEVITGTQAGGVVTTTRFTANGANAANIFAPNGVDSFNASDPTISFNEAWSAPLSVKGGLEYIANDKFTVFGNVGYTYASGNRAGSATVDATVFSEVEQQLFQPELDVNGVQIPGSFIAVPNPTVTRTAGESQAIASLDYGFSDLRQFDLEVGARHYLSPIVKSQGYRTVTPFVGASVGVARVNAVDVDVTQSVTSFADAFGGAANPETFDVSSSTRLYDSQWLPQGQLNVGAEWQVTPGFALAAETGLQFQGSRDFADFVDASGETISGESGDTNISVPLTLRGSVNF